jgi:hypothetical protein
VTKEELLQKGLSEEEADGVVAKYSSEPTLEDDPLQALNKALGQEKATTDKADLNKAEKDEEDDNDEKEYDANYMKKNMKRYMKENKKACQKLMKEMDMYTDKMQKAEEEIDTSSDGVVVEMDDLSPYLTAQNEAFEQLAKAVVSINEQLEVIRDQGVQSYDLMQKAGKVNAMTYETFNKAMSISTGKKGVMASEKMNKAEKLKENSHNQWEILYKATKAGNIKAGDVIGKFETAGRNINLLNPEDQAFIQNLVEGGSN